MSPITSHVLDTARGVPARKLRLVLTRQEAGGSSTILAERETNDDGRVTDLIRPGTLVRGIYCLTFDTEGYFEASGQPVFYPEVQIKFRVEQPAEHHHIPLLLSPFGYSTYRGS
jgi:5-hydroxyisourate hydrolase